jgi:hypothetical protein
MVLKDRSAIVNSPQSWRRADVRKGFIGARAALSE